MRSSSVAAALLVLGGCGSFGTAPETSADGGAPSDGGATSDTGVVDRDSGTSSGCPSSFGSFVEPFDEGWGTSWTSAGTPALTNSTAQSFSAPSSLFLRLVAGESPRFVWRKLPSCRVSVSARIRVDKIGDGEVDLFSLNEGLNPADEGVLIVGGASGLPGKIALEIPIGATPARDQELSFKGGTWSRVTLRMDPAQHVWEANIDDIPFSGTLPAGYPKGPDLYLKVGAPYAVNVSTDWVVYFDDVLIQPWP